ncbi:MAG: chemotaxis protein CheW [Chloroflexi bacterium]|nr:MAG: chemotaxis protein CheW [Chloroflexota bacterium]
MPAPNNGAGTPANGSNTAPQSAPPANGVAKSARTNGDATVAAVNDKQLVVFSLAREFYGIEITLVESIIRMEPVTVVPHAPHFVEGVINMRGEILPVIDLSKRFTLPPVKQSKETRIIVVEANHLRAGIVVDAVSEVLRVSEDIIEPPAPLITGIDTTFISGIAKVPDRLVILLDLAKILSTEEKNEPAAIGAQV